MGRSPTGKRRLSAFLVDTSFLISLADPSRANHATAESYFREALKRGVPLYLSAIAASEFQVKQSVTDLPLRNFEVLPFNIDHAMTAGLLAREVVRDAGDDRAAVKDDVKLIAQAVCESLTHVLTEDQRTLAKHIRKLQQAGHTTLQVILLSDGFDTAWFDNGQRGLPGT